MIFQSRNKLPPYTKGKSFKTCCMQSKRFVTTGWVLRIPGRRTKRWPWSVCPLELYKFQTKTLICDAKTYVNAEFKSTIPGHFNKGKFDVETSFGWRFHKVDFVLPSKSFAIFPVYSSVLAVTLIPCEKSFCLKYISACKMRLIHYTSVVIFPTIMCKTLGKLSL